MEIPRHIIVPIDTFPRHGGLYKILIRIYDSDRTIVKMAADAIGYSQADFVRALIVNGARVILQQMNIPEPVQYAPPQSTRLGTEEINTGDEDDSEYQT